MPSFLTITSCFWQIHADVTTVNECVVHEIILHVWICSHLVWANSLLGVWSFWPRLTWDKAFANALKMSPVLPRRWMSLQLLGCVWYLWRVLVLGYMAVDLELTKVPTLADQVKGAKAWVLIVFIVGYRKCLSYLSHGSFCPEGQLSGWCTWRPLVPQRRQCFPRHRQGQAKNQMCSCHSACLSQFQRAIPWSLKEDKMTWVPGFNHPPCELVEVPPISCLQFCALDLACRPTRSESAWSWRASHTVGQLLSN